jgi:hypothetical protein
LKFGQVVVVAQATHAVTVVRFRSAEQVATMQLKQSLQHLDVHILYVLAELGLVTSHIRVQQVWAVVHT